MAEKSWLLFFVLSAAFQASNSAEWTAEPPDSSVLYACAQGTISLPWTLLLSPGEVTESVQWFVQGQSDELIAVEFRGHFLPMPTFARRVTKGINASLTLDNVQVSDSGNYSVEAFVKTPSGVIVSLWRSAYVHVSDDLQTTDGELHAGQLPVAEYNNETNQHHLVLTCGTFNYPTHPAFQATWQTPSGKAMASSGYRDNQFYLLLTNPVEGGVFSCHVPAVLACIHGNSSTNASVTVDKMEARLALLDSEVRYFKSKTENQKAVSFHARLMNSETIVYPNYPLTFPEVAINVGNGYDFNTSKFTAPYNATYFFIATTQPYSSSQASIALVVDYTELARAVYENHYGYSSGTLTVHAVVHLTQGQMVWVNVVDFYSQSFLGGSTSFSGLLIDITP